MDLSWEEFRLLSEEAEKLGWLRQAIGRAGFVALDEDQLLARAGDLEDEARQAVLTELQIRLSRDSRSLRLKLARLLSELHERFQRPGRHAQSTDRMLDRFMHRLPRDLIVDLALACAQSDRLGRRHAAWHFYRVHGHDDASRAVFASAFPADERWEFLRSICDDAPLIAAIGVQRYLEHLSEFYWRGRTLATVLQADAERFEAIAATYPEEALFAIYLTGAESQKPLAMDLLKANPRNPGVCSTAIRVFGILRAHADLDIAICYGRQILEATTNPFYLARVNV